MKKIVLFVVSMLIVISNPKAFMFEVTTADGFTSSFGFYPKEITGENNYLVSFHSDYQIKEEWLVNNLAYYGTSISDGYTQVAIQKLILEHVNPSYEVVVKKDTGEVIDVSDIEKSLMNEISKYNVEHPISKDSFRVNLGDALELEGFFLDYYIPLNINFWRTDTGMKSDIFRIVKKEELKFANRITIEDDHIYGMGYQYKPFSIFVDVLGNTLTFNTDYTYNGLELEVYENNSLVDNIYLNDYNKIYYYPIGKSLKFVDVTKNSSYELISDIYINNESTELVINRNLKDMKLNVKSFYRSYNYSKEFEKSVNISIYDNEFNLLNTCHDASICEFTLPLGTYYIKDLDTNYMTKERIIRDRTIYLSEYLINGFISKDVLDIKNTTKVGDIYYLNDPIIPDSIAIDGTTYDLKNYNNYIFINNEGLFYEIKKDEVTEEDVSKIDVELKPDVPKEDQAPQVSKEEVPKNESLENEIEISVPDTSNTLSYWIYKKNEEDSISYITCDFGRL